MEEFSFEGCVTMKEFMRRKENVIESLKVEEKWINFLKKFVDELNNRYKSWDEIKNTELFQELQSEYGSV